MRSRPNPLFLVEILFLNCSEPSFWWFKKNQLLNKLIKKKNLGSHKLGHLENHLIEKCFRNTRKVFQKYRKCYRLILKRPGIKMNVHKHPILKETFCFSIHFINSPQAKIQFFWNIPCESCFTSEHRRTPEAALSGFPCLLDKHSKTHTHTDLEMPPPPPPPPYRKHPREPNCSSG